MSKVLFFTILILLLLMQVATSCQAPPDEPVAEISATIPVPSETLDLVSRDATTAVQVLLTATLLPPPTLSAEFLEQERQYQEWMQTRVAEGVLTPTVTPTGTPTPTPIPANTPGYFIFQGEEGLGNAIFRVTYAADEWELENATLMHRRLLDCNFNLDPLAGGVPGPRIDSEIELAGFQWSTRYFPSVKRSSYELDLGEHYFFFGLSFSPNVEEGAMEKCQSAAEKVIGTFELEPQ